MNSKCSDDGCGYHISPLGTTASIGLKGDFVRQSSILVANTRCDYMLSALQNQEIIHELNLLALWVVQVKFELYHDSSSIEI